MLILLKILLGLTALFMIMLVLIQRGRGGGLSGAFGGAGGQSAFGAKAGDMFTKITMVSAAFWIVLCAFSVWYMNHNESMLDQTGGGTGDATQSGGAVGPTPTDDGADE